MPKIQVTFKIDANGVVSIEAKDLATMRSQQVKVTSTSGLTTAEITKLVEESEQYKLDDEMRKELAELRNQAETLLYTTDAAVEGYAGLVEQELLDELRGGANELRVLLEANEAVDTIRGAYQALEAKTFAIAEKLYGGA